MTPNEIIIFTDGSSKGNPGPGGWAAIIKRDGKVEEMGGGEEYSTNNRMELTAAIEALKKISVSNSPKYNKFYLNKICYRQKKKKKKMLKVLCGEKGKKK